MTSQELIGTTDARVWAREFIRLQTDDQCDPTDEGWVLGWFANAIMVGHDWGFERGRLESEAQPMN